METIHNPAWEPGAATHATEQAVAIYGEPRMVFVFYPQRFTRQPEPVAPWQGYAKEPVP